MFRLTRRALVKSLPGGFSYITAPTDVPTNIATDVPSELLLTLTRQDEFLKAQQVVKSVSLSTEEGQIGVQPGHEYVVEKVVSGVIEIETVDGKTEKYATSGGFAHVNTDGSIDINTGECVPLELLDLANCEKELAAAVELEKSGDKDAQVRGMIGRETLEPLVAVLKGI